MAFFPARRRVIERIGEIYKGVRDVFRVEPKRSNLHPPFEPPEQKANEMRAMEQQKEIESSGSASETSDQKETQEKREERSKEYAQEDEQLKKIEDGEE